MEVYRLKEGVHEGVPKAKEGVKNKDEGPASRSGLIQFIQNKKNNPN